MTGAAIAKGVARGGKAEIIRLSRDEIRDRLRDAQEDYFAKRAELAKLLDEAHDRFIAELINAEAWLVARGMPEEGVETIEWPIPPLKNGTPPDSASQFDEISADYDIDPIGGEL